MIDFAMQERNKLRAQVDSLRAALRPFVSAYKGAADPVGDSDLYDEQPRNVAVTLGDCRQAAAILASMEPA